MKLNTGFAKYFDIFHHYICFNNAWVSAKNVYIGRLPMQNRTNFSTLCFSTS